MRHCLIIRSPGTWEREGQGRKAHEREVIKEAVKEREEREKD